LATTFFASWRWIRGCAGCATSVLVNIAPCFVDGRARPSPEILSVRFAFLLEKVVDSIKWQGHYWLSTMGDPCFLYVPRLAAMSLSPSAQEVREVKLMINLYGWVKGVRYMILNQLNVASSGPNTRKWQRTENTRFTVYDFFNNLSNRTFKELFSWTARCWIVSIFNDNDGCHARANSADEKIALLSSRKAAVNTSHSQFGNYGYCLLVFFSFYVRSRVSRLSRARSEVRSSVSSQKARTNEITDRGSLSPINEVTKSC